MRVSIIAAVAENGVIGRDGRLPWKLSEDLQRFKRLTMGHTIIMGRRTWESIGRSLPGRRMIVVSRRPEYRIDVGSIQVVLSLDAGLRSAESAGDSEAFIVGGAELYREALSRADRLYITRVLAKVDGDTVLPAIEFAAWRQKSAERHAADSKNDFPSRFEIYDRA
jgi:dihydrofolate reductase